MVSVINNLLLVSISQLAIFQVILVAGHRWKKKKTILLFKIASGMV